MITFTQSDRRFNYRVAGIAIKDDYVLLHRSEKDSFWTFPGGRATVYTQVDDCPPTPNFGGERQL
jgi:hypothetical protein